MNQFIFKGLVVCYVIEGFTRWLDMDKDMICPGCIQDNQTQLDRRGTSNLSWVSIHLETEGPLKIKIFVWLLL